MQIHLMWRNDDIEHEEHYEDAAEGYLFAQILATCNKSFVMTKETINMDDEVVSSEVILTNYWSNGA